MSRSVDPEIDLPSRKEVQAGLRVQTFERLSRVFGLTEPNLGRHLSIPPATLYRRRSSGRFTREESDRLARLARLYLRALSVLGGRESVREWFMAPNPSLGGRKPFDLTDTDPGCVEVDRLLGRIEYGVFQLCLVSGVIRCWRIVRATRQNSAMDGMGAAYNAGRWNPVGVKMVYCADSLALAILELRVHLAGVKPKRRFVGLEIEISESAVERPELSDLPPSWQRAPPTSTANTAARRFGARWVGEMRSVALQVPSSVVPTESIFLLNPEHPDFAKAVVVRGKSLVPLDPRLWS